MDMVERVARAIHEAERDCRRRYGFLPADIGAYRRDDPMRWMQAIAAIEATKTLPAPEAKP